MRFLVLLLSLFLLFGCEYQEYIDKAVDSQTEETEEVTPVTEPGIIEEPVIIEEPETGAPEIVEPVIIIEEPEEPEQTTELIIIEEGMEMSILPIADYDFFWRQDSGGLQGFKDGNFEAVKIEAEKAGGELAEIKPKAFFTIAGTAYFSADVQEPNPDFDPDYVPEEGEEPVSQHITVEKYFSQVKGGQVVEISALPEQPTSERLELNDGNYNVYIADYQGTEVSDVHRITDDRYCGRNIKISGYWYGYSESFQHTGAFIDIQEGLPNVREAGLYFINDRFTSQTKCAPAGRMWIY